MSLDDEEYVVADSEYRLVLTARSLILGRPDHRGLGAINKLPSHMGQVAADLIADALDKCWMAVWRLGGTQPTTSINETNVGSVSFGRVWERYKASTFEFSKATIQLLRWLTLDGRVKGRVLPAATLTIGDQVALYLALNMLDSVPALQMELAKQPLTGSSGLCYLGFTHLFNRNPLPGSIAEVVKECPSLIDALSYDFTKRWRAAEIAKRSQINPELLLAYGNAQDAVLTEFMVACNDIKRRDLALFIVDSLRPLLEKNIPPFPPAFDSDYPLQLRNSARIAAGALCRALVRWQEWDQAHRMESYFDDGYKISQLLLGRFEGIGSHGVERAQSWLNNLSSLTPVVAKELPETTAEVNG